MPCAREGQRPLENRGRQAASKETRTAVALAAGGDCAAPRRDGSPVGRRRSCGSVHDSPAPEGDAQPRKRVGSELRGNLFVDPEMFFDCGDALQRVIDFFGETSMACALLFQPLNAPVDHRDLSGEITQAIVCCLELLVGVIKLRRRFRLEIGDLTFHACDIRGDCGKAAFEYVAEFAE
jgi:hypothetical protein